MKLCHSDCMFCRITVRKHSDLNLRLWTIKPCVSVSHFQLHFRLSATILKLLEADEPDLEHEVFFNLLVEAATGPFARGEEKSMPSMPRSQEK